MNASETGSRDWWIVVLSMPIQERIDHLNRYKCSLLEQHGTHVEAATKLTRVNAEIKRANLLFNEGCWQNACRNILTEDQLHAVHMERRRLQGELQT